MENTIENKARLFAQYWGQSVWSHLENDEDLTDYTVNQDICISHDMDCLLLKPLSSINDEDAVKVAKILHPNVKEWQKPYKQMKDIWIDSDDESEAYVVFTEELFETSGGEFITYDNFLKVMFAIDYLRSKRYALPFMNLSVEKQLEYGWIKLK